MSQDFYHIGNPVDMTKRLEVWDRAIKNEHKYEVLYNKLRLLTTKYSAEEIQGILGMIYAEYESMAKSESEYMYYEKLWKSSINLSGGMRKWLEDLLSEEDSEEV